MKIIHNPYDHLDGHKCFACSKKNEFGLHMEFFEEGENVISLWQPQPQFQGYENILHGGIQATLMDEIASWIVQLKIKTVGFTASLNTRYLKPVATDKGKIKLIANITNIRRNLIDIHVQLFNHEDILCAKSEITFFTYSDKIAKEKFHFIEH